MFVVKYYDMTFSSQYLDDALENLAEDRRRSVNRMQPVRDKLSETKTAPATTTSSTAAAYVPPFQASPSIHQAAQQAYQQQAALIDCDKCAGKGCVSSPHFGMLPCIKCYASGKIKQP